MYAFRAQPLPLQTYLDLSLEVDLLAKTMNQEHSTVMSQVASSEENLDISTTFGHETQTSLLVHFLSQEFYRPYYTLFLSENTNLKTENKQFSRIFEDKSKDIERWGSGIKRIHDECAAAGVKVEFNRLKTGFVVVFYRPKWEDGIHVVLTKLIEVIKPGVIESWQKRIVIMPRLTTGKESWFRSPRLITQEIKKRGLWVWKPT